ncbi:MAG TPA: 30S ribosomal protein S20 [bacterium]|nr:30S ribosomal protein S20 [bacterium]
MPQHQSAEKRARQNERRRLRNQQDRSRMKTAIKKVRNQENKEEAAVQLQKTISILDRMAGKGIIHKNKAANLKSRLTRFVSRM